MVSCPITFVGPATEKKGVIIEDNEEEDCDDHCTHARFDAFDDDTTMEELEAEAAEDDPIDDLWQALRGAPKDCEIEKERMKLQLMLEDHRKLLYPDYEHGLKKLGSALELLQWNATHGLSNKGLCKLLK